MSASEYQGTPICTRTYTIRNKIASNIAEKYPAFTDMANQVVVVMVPLPAQGHLNQLLQLSRLILSYNIPVHFVGGATHNRQAKVRVHGWDPDVAANISFHDFEVPHFLCPAPKPHPKNKFPSHLQLSFNATSHLQEPVGSFLREIASKTKRVIVIHDSLMGSVVQDVRYISNAESYTFHSVSAFTMYLFKMEKLGKPVVPNGLIPQELPSLEGCFTNEFSEFVASQYEHHKFNSGYIYNTCRLIEGEYMELLQKETTQENSIKHWALGPFNPVARIPEGKIPKKRHFSLEWLDKQERNSVIYVSFGTTTTMNDEEIKELATGLKQSKQKFIWVLRDADKGDIFDGNDRKALLPIEGYEDSVNGRGLIVRDWAPQLEILAHPATGGFISHCGWNSCMESITMGVPIAAWPMHSDQPRNAVLIARILKIGLVVKDWSDPDPGRHEIVGSSVVESCVKRLMASREGDEMRKRAAELGDALRRSAVDGGVSWRELDSFMAHITR